jgi:broad specificity phosphatase PhoE
MRLYYVRHGLTDWNSAGRLQGRHDVPLNDIGRVQAAQCGAILRDLLACDGVTAAQCGYVSSPLVRARATMEIMRATLGLPSLGYGIDPRLAEISFGDWEGLTYAEVIARAADVVARREADKWNFRPPGGETYQEVALRAGAWYATLERETIVAAHGGIARALIAWLKIEPPEAAVHHSIDHGVVYVLEPKRLARYARAPI